MKKERKPKSFLQKPSYPGGPKAMRKFLSEQISYPKAAFAEKIEGTVRLRMDIDYQGKVISAKVLSSLGYGCDEEAIRVVKLLRFHTPKLRKIRAKFHKTINIHFNYPKEKKANKTTVPPSAQQVSYSITTTESTSTDDQDNNGGNSSYHYTIKI